MAAAELLGQCRVIGWQEMISNIRSTEILIAHASVSLTFHHLAVLLLNCCNTARMIYWYSEMFQFYNHIPCTIFELFKGNFIDVIMEGYSWQLSKNQCLTIDIVFQVSYNPSNISIDLALSNFNNMCQTTSILVWNTSLTHCHAFEASFA